MPHISEMKESKFLRKEDVGKGLLVTIANCVKQNTAMEGAPREDKWCLLYRELEKPHVLNMTNANICAQVFGSEDTDDWIGKQIVLYVDPNVSYGGKIIGGIRMRKPKVQAPPVPPPPAAMLTDDEIPF